MKRMMKLLSIALCLSIVLSMSLVGVFAMSMNGVSLKSLDLTEAADEIKAALYKDESVYVMAQADGTVDKIIVSDWIRNNQNAAKIADLSTVDDIENVKTDTTYTLNADHMRVWETEGKDLYLKGTGKEPLPVDLSLTYALDGKAVTPEQLAGKSGKVTIRFGYRNNQFETVEINGVKERIYVPFLMMSGLILDGDKFTNVQVTNGKVISDGDRTIVAGIAFPGLRHDLGLKQDDLDIPDYVEVTADVKDFALGSTVTVAANGLVNHLDPEKLDSFDEVKDSVSELESAMSQLIDGSSQLYDGLATLLEKSSELTDGIDRLYAGAEELSDGADQVESGAEQLSDGASALQGGTAQLVVGTGSLSAGTAKLKGGSSELADGTKQLKDGSKELAGGTKQLKDGSKELAGGTDQLKNGTKQLSGGAQQVNAGTAQLADGLDTLSGNNELLTNGSAETFKALLATAREQLIKAGLDVPELTIENYDAVLDALIENLSEDNVKAQAEATAREKVTAAVEAQRDTVQAAVTAAVRDNITSAVTANVSAQVTAAVLEQLGYSVDDYNAAVAAGMVDDATQTQVAAAIDSKMAENGTQTLIKNMVDQQMQGDQALAAIEQNTQAQISALIEQNMQGDEVQQGISDALVTAADAVKRIAALKAQLDEYNTFNTGLKQYTDGVASASDGAKTLKNATSQLSDGAQTVDSGAAKLDQGAKALNSGAQSVDSGAQSLSGGAKAVDDGADALDSGADELNIGALSLNTGAISLNTGAITLRDGSVGLKDGTASLSDGADILRDGILTLKNGVPALTEGVNQLTDGGMQLSDGLKEFNEKGISKIVSLLGDDMGNFVTRLKATIEVSKKYKSYSGLTDEMDGEVKFIYKTSEIKSDK